MSEKSSSTDDKLDAIIKELQKINARERLRMVSGFFRGIIGLLPIIIMLIGAWYAYVYSDQLLEKIAAAAAAQAASFAQRNPAAIIDTSSIQELLEQYLR